MKTVVAQTAGFCMGVRRAVEITRNTAARHSGKRVYTLGELIHNKQVVSELSELGVEVADVTPESGVVVIRAHGVTQACKDELLSRGIEVVDATCPHVLSSQKLIARYSADGGRVLILGDSNHPEVIGLCGHASSAVSVISSLDELGTLELPETFLFIAQTTFSQELFNRIADYLKDKYPECTVVDSICDATQKRQNEAERLAEENEMMVVVGGKHSANTRRLVEIAEEKGIRVYHIEDVSELSKDYFSGCTSVAVTAGASTPVAAVEAVIGFIEGL